MKTISRILCVIAFISAGSSFAQEQDLSKYSLDSLIQARWHLLTDMSCAKATVGSWMKNVTPGQMVGEIYSGLAKNLGQVMSQALSSSPGTMSQADSDAGWCYGQSLVADKLDAAINAKLKALPAAEYAKATSSLQKTLDETRGALHLSQNTTSSLSGN